MFRKRHILTYIVHPESRRLGLRYWRRSMYTNCFVIHVSPGVSKTAVINVVAPIVCTPLDNVQEKTYKYLFNTQIYVSVTSHCGGSRRARREPFALLKNIFSISMTCVIYFKYLHCTLYQYVWYNYLYWLILHIISPQYHKVTLKVKNNLSREISHILVSEVLIQ